MKRDFESGAALPEQPETHQHIVTRLDQCGDVLSIAELAGVLGLSVRTIGTQEQQGTFPIPRLKGLGTGRRLPRRYAKVAVQKFFERRGV